MVADTRRQVIAMGVRGLSSLRAAKPRACCRRSRR